MLVLALNPGHDGAAACLEDGRVEFVLEAEKDSYDRFEAIQPITILKALTHLPRPADVFAITGGVKVYMPDFEESESGYFGINDGAIRATEVPLMGRHSRYFTSSHERSHLLGAYALSPFPQGEPCYALIWEGGIGAFYVIDESLHITRVEWVMNQPGKKYEFMFYLADNTGRARLGAGIAGKMMALASYSDRGAMQPHERDLAEFVLAQDNIHAGLKESCRCSPLYESGVDSPAFKNFSGKFSDLIFARFYEVAARRLTKRWPLLIAGGCGLNCEWNSRWKDCGLFRDVFVPPCANDSGCALGTAIDAQWFYTGSAKVSWDVYLGEPFEMDVSTVDGFEAQPLDYQQVAAFLRDGNVVAWVQGRCELGPRALGNRSLFAAPFSDAMQDRLNDIKQREGYRPIAPICLEEEVSEHFAWQGPSPYMLYFQQMRTERLRAVTHVDHTARVQTVNSQQNPRVYQLLRAFKALTGFGVLCNTSLNFKGRGFINRMSDLIRYCQNRNVDGFVVKDRFFVRQSSPVHVGLAGVSGAAGDGRGW